MSHIHIRFHRGICFTPQQATKFENCEHIFVVISPAKRCYQLLQESRIYFNVHCMYVVGCVAVPYTNENLLLLVTNKNETQRPAFEQPSHKFS